MDFFKIPGHALHSFEHLTGTQVTCYDLSADFGTFLGDRHNCHNSRICFRAKQKRGDAYCEGFDIRLFRREAWRFREGGIKICHAGLMEYVMPVYDGERLILVLQAGLRFPPGKLPEGIALLSSDERWEEFRDSGLHPTARAEEIPITLEALYQLGLRLREWRRELYSVNRQKQESTRENRILEFIHARGRGAVTLNDLAGHLSLSKSRAAHAVREATGRSFKELLTDFRIRSAQSQLRYSDVPVREIAGSCGFATLSQFFRTFKQHCGKTPLAYRRSPVGPGRASG